MYIPEMGTSYRNVSMTSKTYRNRTVVDNEYGNTSMMNKTVTASDLRKGLWCTQITGTGV
jgi:hypothetical protein